MSKAGTYGQSSKSGEGRMIGQLELAKMCHCYRSGYAADEDSGIRCQILQSVVSYFFKLRGMIQSFYCYVGRVLWLKLYC